MKKPGCCTTCGKPVYEILTKWTQGLLKGEPRKVGKPKHEAMRVNFILSDGSTMPLTFCEGCLNEAMEPENFPNIWNIVLQAFEREISKEYVAAIQLSKRTEKQQNAVDDFVATMSNTFIVGTAGYVRVEETMWNA